MLLQVTWSPWVGAPLAVDHDLKAAVVITFGITQPLEVTSLRVLYLAEKISC